MMHSVENAVKMLERAVRISADPNSSYPDAWLAGYLRQTIKSVLIELDRDERKPSHGL